MNNSHQHRTSDYLWLGLLGLVILFFFTLLFEAIPMENRLVAQVSGVLGKADYRRLKVTASGRDVRLSGRAASAASLARAEQLAMSVSGVRKVSSAVELRPLKLPHLQIDRANDGSLRVIGQLSNSHQVDSISYWIASEISQTAEVQISANPELAESPWLDLLEPVLESTTALENFRLTIGAGVLEVRGILPNAVEYPALEARLEVLAREVGMRFDNGIGLL